MSPLGPSQLGDGLRSLVVGIGGGGDVVGALAIGREIEAAGGGFELGGVSWERWSVDPHPGPRRLGQLSGIERLGGAEGFAALCGPDGRTPEGVSICEAGVAAHLGRPTVLIDVTGGSRRAAAGIASACERLGCDRVILTDVGGDVLAVGEEHGLSSPLCDAVMLAAARFLPDSIEAVGCVFGAGCDGELTGEEVLRRIAVLARLGIWSGTFSPSAKTAAELVELAAIVPTEASLCAARCALGEVGPTSIRAGRRTVELGPLGALAFLFEPVPAIGAAAPLAAVVAEAESIGSARDALAAIGVRTELDYELELAGGASPETGA